MLPKGLQKERSLASTLIVAQRAFWNSDFNGYKRNLCCLRAKLCGHSSQQQQEANLTSDFREHLSPN
jgi:hypothetical protein